METERFPIKRMVTMVFKTPTWLTYAAHDGRANFFIYSKYEKIQQNNALVILTLFGIYIIVYRYIAKTLHLISMVRFYFAVHWQHQCTI